jgi:hypothetical protein
MQDIKCCIDRLNPPHKAVAKAVLIAVPQNATYYYSASAAIFGRENGEVRRPKTSKLKNCLLMQALGIV